MNKRKPTYNWREDCPLNGAERYLWRKLQGFPDHDWRKPHPPKSAEHIYYEEGWELVHHIEDMLFAGGASFGCKWPYGGPARGKPLFNIACSRRKCGRPVEAVVRGRMYCHGHGYRAYFGQEYVPPTQEEINRHRAMFRAREQMMEERPPQTLQLDYGLKIDSFTMMDGPYLKRLAKLTSDEYDKIKREN